MTTLLCSTGGQAARALAVAVAICPVGIPGASSAEPLPPDERRVLEQWELLPGFALEVAATGFEYPTALAFVPDPGPEPDAPLFFVTELRGRVKLVTRDGSVHLFAEGFSAVRDQARTPGRVLVESGTAGICLAPEQGFVFVSFVYRGPRGVLRNGLMRFEAEPRRFSLREQGRLDLSPILRVERSIESHQIGPCQVEDDRLYVAVGDAFQRDRGAQLGSTLGKILRMQLDGEPVPENPFYREAQGRRPVNYVFALGLRNVFGLEIERGRVFVAENGPRVDRFFEVRAGEKVIWDGHNWSMGTNAAQVFAPAVSPVQLEHYPEGSGLFPPEHRGRFYVALAGSLEAPGPGRSGEKSIITLEYDFDRRRMRTAPQHFLRYRGEAIQAIAGLAFGPDGLYFAPLLPGPGGEGVVLRVRHDPEHAHPYRMGETHDPVLLMEQNGCLGCHTLAGKGGTVGPALDREALVARNLERLASADYRERLAAVDALGDEPYAGYTDARREVLAASGMDRLRTWLRYRLLEPRFDSFESRMPNAGLSEREAILIADHLLEVPTTPAERGAPERAEGPAAGPQGGPARAEAPPPADGISLAALLGSFALGAAAMWTAGVLRRRPRAGE